MHRGVIALPPYVAWVEGSEAYPLLEISHPLCRAKVALHGAHLMEWTPAGHEPVIYLSPAAILREGKAIRGGVPVCWPWFNAHPGDATQPSHGVARNRFWELTAARAADDGVHLSFTLPCTDSIRAIWNHAFEVRLEMHLGARLQIRLTTRNTGDSTFPVSGALHTYFKVGDVRQVAVSGLDGTEFLDTTVTPWQSHRQTGEVTVSGEIDRIYASSADVVLEDPVLQRRLHIGKTGSASTVVWNPDVRKASGMGDLSAEEVTKFLCIEAANANAAAVTLAPGAEHTLSMTVNVERV